MASANIAQLIASAAAANGVDPNLALEVAITESNLNQDAIGSAGEIGVMQLMPATAAGLGVDPRILASNVAGGVRLLAQLLAHYGGDPEKAVAAYNAGQETVDRAIAQGGENWFSLIPISTQDYINGIISAVYGSAYQASVTPASVAGGVGDVAASTVDSLAEALPAVQNEDGSVNGGNVLVYVGIGLLAYFGLRAFREAIS